MPLPRNYFFISRKIRQRIMNRQFLLYLISINITYSSISLLLIIALLVLLTKLDQDFQVLFIIQGIFLNYLHIDIYEFAFMLLLLAVGSTVFTVAVKKEIRWHIKELSFSNLSLILNAFEKRRTVIIIYISATLSILVFIATFGLSPTLSENKESIDKEMKKSLLALSELASKNIESNDVVSLMKVYPITNGNYVYSISLNESMENDMKYVSSGLERVVFISPQSPVLDKNLLGKVYDYKYSEGTTDDNTFWTYHPSKSIEAETRVDGSMLVSIPRGKCASLEVTVNYHSNPSPMQRNGEHGDIGMGSFAVGRSECNDYSDAYVTKNIYANQVLPGIGDDVGLKVQFTDIKGNTIDPRFYDRVAFYKNLDRNLTDKNFFDPSFSKAQLILDRSNVINKTPPEFCIQGYNLGYKENIWSYHSKESTLENKSCDTQ